MSPYDALTVEAWIRIGVPAAYTRFLGKANRTEGNAYGLEAELSGSRPGFNLTLDGQERIALATTIMASGGWYHLAGTWDGSEQRIYVNGVLENAIPRSGAVSDFGQPVALGKQAFNHYVNLEGDLDEPRVARVARSAAWIKLAYANQNANRKFISFEPYAGCTPAFTMPADTAIDEGSNLVLSADVRCADALSWTVLAGPAPRILDPEYKTLTTVMPRVTGDAQITYSLTADFGGARRSGEVKVTIREAIPDPAFVFPQIPAWDGSGPLNIVPVITNAAALLAAQAPALRYAWTLDGLEADTVMLAGALRLAAPKADGQLVLGLCLDNGGVLVCKSMTLEATGTTGLATFKSKAKIEPVHRKGRDLNGRFLPLFRLGDPAGTVFPSRSP